jgi:hypothetical protein
MKDIQIEFRKETGYDFQVHVEDYIEFLENKIADLQKQNTEIINNHNYKEDFENAQDEIDRLEDQLFDANEEILNLNSQIPLEL